MGLFSQKKKEKAPESGVSSQLKKELEKVQSKPLTRIVNLIYKDCCGCGCYDTAITRQVPMDSLIKDGDKVDKLESTDRIVY